MNNKYIYFTFDMDWASDIVLENFCSLINDCAIKSTIHVTHKTAFLKELRKNTNVELGIHPNYNPLFLDKSPKNIKQVLQEIKEIVPEAVTVRSHALTSSSLIAREYGNFNIKYELNTYIPVKKGNVIFPFDSPIGSYKVLPFIYEDDLSLIKEYKDVHFYLSNDFVAPRIFNFHPIHLFLNSDSIDTYERARPYFNSSELRNCINSEKYGIRDFFVDLVECSKKEGWINKRINEGEWD